MEMELIGGEQGSVSSRMRDPAKTYHRADVLLGKADRTPSIVEAVQFHGIGITKNDALVKEVSELYRSANLDQLVHNSHLAAKHLQEVGLMDNATALIDTAHSSNGYVVNFVVKEPKPFTLGVKAGMSTQGDADVSVNAGKQSVAGRGEALNATYSYTVKGDHSFNVSFLKPFLGWQKYSNVSASLYRSMAYLPWNHANVDENALILQYNGQLLAKRIMHTVKTNSIWRTMRAGDDAAFTVREHSGHTMKFSLENTVAFDTRDRPLLPTRGLLARLSQEYAGPLGDSQFLRNQVDLQASSPLFWDIILSASLQLKAVRSLGAKELHLLDRAYLGGNQDLRGFALNSIGTRADSSCLGSGTALAGVLHLYKPLFPPNMLFAHAWLASGAVASVHSKNPVQDMSDNQRTCAGLGLTLVFKNIFRIEVNYVHPLRSVPGDNISRGIHIGAGVNFL